MIRKGTIAVFVSVLSFSAFAVQGEFYKTNRIEYINESLHSLLSSNKSVIQNSYFFLRLLKNNQCISSVKQLQVDCLIEGAKRNCSSFRGKQRERCGKYSDVILSVLLEEPRIITRSVKSKLAEAGGASLQQSIFQEMQKHYAVVAVDLLASKEWKCKADQWECVARSIHNYCDRYTSEKSGSWQGCTSGLVMFIGLHQRGKTDGKRDI
mgnify:FL=1